MSEALTSPQKAFPEFNGDLSRWETSLKDVDGIFSHPYRGHEFESQLSEIVGYMPEEEMSAVTNLLDTSGEKVMRFEEDENRMFLLSETEKLSEIEKFMPNTLSVIASDIALVTRNRASLGVVEAYREHARAGESPIGAKAPSAGTVHIDGHSLEERLPWYLISDVFPTLSYEGRLRVRRYRYFDYMVDPKSLDAQAFATMPAAPRLAIVRMSPAAPHASPFFPEEASRTCIRILSKTLLSPEATKPKFSLLRSLSH